MPPRYIQYTTSIHKGCMYECILYDILLYHAFIILIVHLACMLCMHSSTDCTKCLLDTSNILHQSTKAVYILYTTISCIHHTDFAHSMHSMHACMHAQ